MRPHVIEVDEAGFETSVVEASRSAPVVVDFWAGWCRPCLVLGPILERLAEDYAGRFVLAKVDVDTNPALASRFRIQGIPAVKAFVGGTVASEFVGAQPEEVVRRFIDALVPSESDDLAAEAAAAELRDEPDAAEAVYRRALELEPDHPRATVGLAGVLAGRGDVEEARRLLLRVPQDPDGRRLAARLELARLGGHEAQRALDPLHLGRFPSIDIDQPR